MNRMKLYRHDEHGAVMQAVVIITQSRTAISVGGMRFRTTAEAERELLALGWTRTKLKPLTAQELADA